MTYDLTMYYDVDEKDITSIMPNYTNGVVQIDLEVTSSSQEEEGHGKHVIGNTEVVILSIFRLDRIGGYMDKEEIAEVTSVLDITSLTNHITS